MSFITAINCMDGRVQEPVISWLKKQYNVNYVDMITEPGPIKILAEQKPPHVLQSIKNRVDISVHKHGSDKIALIAHYDCAGNPVEKEIQLEQLKKAIETVLSWDFPVELLSLWVDDNWSVYKI